MSTDCIFCPPLLPAIEDSIIEASDLAWSRFDGAPLTEGHALILPRRHVSRLEGLTPEEVSEIHELTIVTLGILRARFGFKDYNLGLNDGPEAGQTVGHLHFHILPRYPNDGFGGLGVKKMIQDTSK